MELLSGVIQIFGRLKAIFFHDGLETSSSPPITTPSSSNGINKSSSSVTTGYRIGALVESMTIPSRTASPLSSLASTSGSVPLDIPTKYGSTTTSSCESIDLLDDNSSINIDDDYFDFSPSLPRRKGFDLDYGEPDDFPISFKYIPLTTKPMSSKVVRPPRRYQVVLRKRRRQAPDLRVPTPILERSSFDEQSFE